MRAETILTPKQPDPAAADPGMGGPEPDLGTELDLSSVPDGLKVPGENGLPGCYYELRTAHEKGLMASMVPYYISPTQPIGGSATMDGYFDERYCQRYAYYRKAMEVYLLELLRLDAYDKMMEDSGLCFVPMPEDKKGEHQKRAVLGLEHLFVLNSPHIERLSLDDIALLERLYQENGSTGEITQEALDFVARTYSELIRKYSGATQAPHPKGTRLIESSGVGWDADSLVIVFLAPYRYGEDGDYMPDEGELIYQREDWLVAELPKMRRQMIEKVDVPVTLVTCDLGDSWYITVDDKVRLGVDEYRRNPRWPEKKQAGSANGAVPQPVALSRQGE